MKEKIKNAFIVGGLVGILALTSGCGTTGSKMVRNVGSSYDAALATARNANNTLGRSIDGCKESMEKTYSSVEDAQNALLACGYRQQIIDNRIGWALGAWDVTKTGLAFYLGFAGGTNSPAGGVGSNIKVVIKTLTGKRSVNDAVTGN